MNIWPYKTEQGGGRIPLLSKFRNTSYFSQREITTWTIGKLKIIRDHSPRHVICYVPDNTAVEAQQTNTSLTVEDQAQTMRKWQSGVLEGGPPAWSEPRTGWEIIFSTRGRDK